MLQITIRFQTGKYHANPWGKHINEGAVEWPPSPWRLLRSWIAAYEQNGSNVSDDETFLSLLNKCSEVPEFYLPKASHSHTRHYMPTNHGKGSALIFDTFIHIGEDPIAIIWKDVTLSESEDQLLQSLLKGISYFGRSQSWCEMKVVPNEISFSTNCFPFNPKGSNDQAIGLEASYREKTYEIANTICPVKDFQSIPSEKRKFSPGKKQKPILLETIRDALSVQISAIRHNRLSSPIGSRRVMYFRPEDAFAGKAGRPKPKPRQGLPKIARFQIDAHVLPLITNTLPIAEHFRNALLKLHKEPSATFSGKDQNGNPLKGHQHAFFIPEDLDNDGRIDHLMVYAENGFSVSELRALTKLSKLSGKESVNDLYLLLLGLHETLPGTAATEWISKTPFIAIRHPKIKKQKDLLDDQIVLEARHMGLIPPIEIETLSDTAAITGHGYQWREFKRKRWNQPGQSMPFAGFRVKFDQPISSNNGYLNLGRFSHYGMGVFVPVK